MNNPIDHRENWRGVHNGAFDERDRLLYVYPNRVHTGSELWANNFHCSKCGCHFFYPEDMKDHAHDCIFRFSTKIVQSLPIALWHVTCPSPAEEKEACEELSNWTMRETLWDFPILTKERWLTPEFRSHAFVLTDDQALTGYLLIREKLKPEAMKARRLALPPNEEDQGVPCEARWALGEIFTVRQERRRAYARRLLDAALRHLNLNLTSIAFLFPFTDSGWQFTQSLGLQEIVVASR